MTELVHLEWEARQRPSPSPRVCEPWALVLERQQELRRNWLPPREWRRHDDGRFKAADDEKREMSETEMSNERATQPEMIAHLSEWDSECSCGIERVTRAQQQLLNMFDEWYGDKAYRKHDEIVSWADALVDAERERIAAAIEAYEPAAHPPFCPPDIAYQAAMERAATIARQGGAA